MRRLPLLAVLVALLLPAGAGAATRFYIRGAGFGHGVGMSQYGAYGFAQHGKDYRFILSHYYTGTDLGRAAPGQVVRVLLQSVRGSARFAGATSANGRTLRPDSTYQVSRRDGDRVVLRSASGRRLKTFTAPLRVTAGGQPVQLLGKAGNGVRDGTYRGALEFRPGLFGGVNAINALKLDDYVQGVIPVEMPASWPAEALRAQAVAARTYAITSNVSGAGFDQYPDTRSQVYGGVARETPASNQAAVDTRGQIVTYGGQPVTTYFFSTSGGRTENVELSFLSAQPDPWLQSVDDPFDSLSPKHRWGPYKLTLRQAQRRLGGLVQGSFRGIKVLRRGRSPRVVAAEVVGTGGRTRVTGPQLRARLHLFDTWAYFTTMSSGKKAPEEPDSASSGGGQPVDPTGGAAFPQAAAARAARTFAGRITPGREGAQLVVEELRGSAWEPVATTRINAGGTYRVTVDHAGVFRVRYRELAAPAVRVK